VRNTAEIGMFRIVSESGIAAGVRRIEAITGTRAYEAARDAENTLAAVADAVKANPATVLKRVTALADERRALEKRVSELMRGGAGGGPVQELLDGATVVSGVRVVAKSVSVPDQKAMQELADAAREKAGDAVIVLAGSFDGKHAIVAAVGDAARDRGARADAIVKTLAQEAGGRGGGKPQLAQGGLPSGDAIPTLLARVPALVGEQVG
jgi:alanyl-tRNA synthetase